MTDREMLELAAKAAGIVIVCYDGDTPCIGESGYLRWSPLRDDGDALRLVVKLRIDICHNHSADHKLWVLAERAGIEGCFSPVCCVEDEFEECGRDAATRCAITRAAAEIGKAMP